MRLLSICLTIALVPISITSVANVDNGLEQTKVSIFTIKQYPITHPQWADEIFYLDTVENLEESTATLFSKNPTVAEQQAKQWLQSEQGYQLQESLKEAYKGVIKGWQIGVMKVPAIVFENPDIEPVVIYGQSNLPAAVAQYKLYRSKNALYQNN